MRQTVKHVVLLPVGPALPRAFVQDTLDSIRHYSDPDRRIIIIDNRGEPEPFRPAGDDIDYLAETSGTGVHGGFYLTISKAMRHALEKYDFQVLLRLDDDALFTGPNPEDQAIERFRSDPGFGQLGSYHWTCMGYRRDLSWPAGQLRSELDPEPGGDPRQQALATALAPIYQRARRHGYVDGEHCLGAATYYTRECLERLETSGLLGITELGHSHLTEDQLMGLVVRATGLKVAEFEQGDDPLCLDWLNLPCSPDEIIGRGKKITHSVKRWGDMEQGQIRAWFRARRQADQ